MAKLIRLLLPMAVLIAIGVLAIQAYTRKVARDEHQMMLDRVRETFAEQAGFVRPIADDDQRWRQFASLTKWYFASLDDVHNRFPELPDDALPLPARAPPATPGSEAKTQDTSDWLHLAQQAFDELRTGRYNPQLSAAGLGGALRLDLYQIARIDQGGQPGLDVRFVLWGAPRHWEENEAPGGGKILQMVVPVSFGGLAFKFTDASGKLVAQMSGGGEPHLRVDYPERFIPGFPPDAVIGEYQMPAFPPQAARMTFDLTVEVHDVAGMPLAVPFHFDSLIQDAWRNTTWNGQKLTLPEDEIDPAKAKARAPARRRRHG